MTRDERQIFETLEQFTRCWESGKTEGLDKLFTRSIRAYMSMFGRCYTLGTLKGWLSARPHKDIRSASFRLYNRAAVADGDYAKATARLIGLFAEEGGARPRHIVFGGTFANELRREDGVWRIDTLRFELQTDNAIAREFVAENGLVTRIAGPGSLDLLHGWKQVNDRFSYQMPQDPEQGARVILAEFDAPWSRMQHRDNVPQDAEDGIREGFARYCFANDFRMARLMADIFTDDAVIDLGEKHPGMSKREAILVLKQIIKGLPRSFHCGEIESIRQTEEGAHAVIRRLSPEMTTMERTAEGGLSARMDAGSYDTDWVYTDGAWKMRRLSYM